MQTNVVILLSLLIYVVKSQFAVPGKCANVPVYKNINEANMIGKWYTVKQFENPHNRNCKCVTEYIQRFDDKGFNGTYTFIETDTNKRVVGTYNGNFKEDPSRATFTCSLTVDNNTVYIDTSIVHVDFKFNYIIWYTCTEDDVNSYSIIWVQAKNKTLPAEANQEMINFLEKYNIDTSELIDIINDCEDETETLSDKRMDEL